MSDARYESLASMNGPTALFDRTLIRKNRDRAAASFAEHDFLVAHVARELTERLDVMMHDFPVALDLGAYRGDLGRALAVLPKIGRLISAELSERLARACPRPSLVCDDERLPFADASLDLIVSGLSLQLVNDLPGALIQIRRALKPDGLFLGAILGGESLRELREVLVLAESEMQGGASPRVAPFADIRQAGALLQRAGFALPVTDTEMLTVRYRNLLGLMHDLRGMGAANALTERRKEPLLRRTLARAEALYRERFADADGRLPATFEIVYLSGWAPSPDQQKPLRPGSAKMRLSEALGSIEQTAGEKAPSQSRPDKKDD